MPLPRWMSQQSRRRRRRRHLAAAASDAPESKSASRGQEGSGAEGSCRQGYGPGCPRLSLPPDRRPRQNPWTFPMRTTRELSSSRYRASVSRKFWSRTSTPTASSLVQSSMRTTWRSWFTPFGKSVSSSQLLSVLQLKRVENPTSSSWASVGGGQYRPRALKPSPQLSVTPPMMTSSATPCWKTCTGAS